MIMGTHCEKCGASNQSFVRSLTNDETMAPMGFFGLVGHRCRIAYKDDQRKYFFIRHGIIEEIRAKSILLRYGDLPRDWADIPFGQIIKITPMTSQC